MAEQALAIFAGEIANHALVQNKEIRQQNVALEPMRDLLLKVQIIRRGKPIWSGSLLHCQEDRFEHYLALRVKGVEPFTLDEINGLCCTILGSTLVLPNWKKRTLHWGCKPATTVLDYGILQVVLKLSDAIYLVGLLENCTGTMKELQHMVDTNMLMYYLSHLGYANASTGRPSRSTSGTRLEGSTFRPTKIMLAKDVVESALHKVSGTNVRKYIGEPAACEFKELGNLYQSSKAFSASLRSVVEERKLLLLENAILKSSMDLLDTVKIRYPGGPSMTTKLGSGKRSTDPDGAPLWRVEVPRANGTIPFRSIRRMQICVAGFSLDTDGPHIHGVAVDEDCTIMRLPYHAAVEAWFIFDDSWDRINNAPVGPFVDRLRNQLAGYQELPPGSKLTMRLWFVRFRLGVVHRHLDALGIHFPTDGKA